MSIESYEPVVIGGDASNVLDMDPIWKTLYYERIGDRVFLDGYVKVINNDGRYDNGTIRVSLPIPPNQLTSHASYGVGKLKYSNFKGFHSIIVGDKIEFESVQYDSVITAVLSEMKYTPYFRTTFGMRISISYFVDPLPPVLPDVSGYRFYEGSTTEGYTLRAGVQPVRCNPGENSVIERKNGDVMSIALKVSAHASNNTSMVDSDELWHMLRVPVSTNVPTGNDFVPNVTTTGGIIIDGEVFIATCEHINTVECRVSFISTTTSERITWGKFKTVNGGDLHVLEYTVIYPID